MWSVSRLSIPVFLALARESGYVPVRLPEEGWAGRPLAPRERRYHSDVEGRVGSWWAVPPGGGVRNGLACSPGRGGAAKAGRGADGTTGAGWGGNGTGATMAP